MSTQEKIKFKFFNILKFGFYNFDNNESFPNQSEILIELTEWAKSQGTLINTECYEKDSDSNIYGTYFYDHHEFNNRKDGILILWNELETDNEKVFSISQFTKPGQGKIEKTKLNTNSIPGKPSYYWFNYEKNFVAAIILESSVSKKENLERYIFGFLKNHSKYKSIDKSSDDIIITNYINPIAEKQLLHSSHPLVKFSTQKNKNIKKEIIGRYKEITKLITKEHLLWRKKDHRARIERIFSTVFSNPPKLSGQKTFKQEISFKPSLKQVKEIIRNFEDHITENSIKNIGFRFKDQSILMLDGAALSKEITNEIIYNEDGFASIASIVNLINNNKDYFLHHIEEIADENDAPDDDEEIIIGQTLELFGE